MINLLSYVGMSLQSEVCMWTLMGLIRTVFDATLFKVNANLKQVWQMNMPLELALPVQRVIRFMISGVMLVQCFTVYVYLAAYIVLLCPVFLEERPALVLPWLLLAAVRQLLCELTSLALGLGVCVLMGASRPPCIKFVISKIVAIMPSLYMWMVVLSYYHFLKVSAVYKTFSAAPASSTHDFSLELAIRRRLTKSLFNEEMLRKKLLTNLYDRELNTGRTSADLNCEVLPILTDSVIDTDLQLIPLSMATNNDSSDTGNFQDTVVTDIPVPRDTDRILEQFILMLLKVSTYLKSEGNDSYKLYVRSSSTVRPNYLDCSTLCSDLAPDTQPHVCSTGGSGSSYLTDFPQIFRKRRSDSLQLLTSEQFRNNDSDEYSNTLRTSFRSVSFSPGKEISIEIEKSVSCKTIDTRKKSSNKLSDTLTLDKMTGPTQAQKPNTKNKKTASKVIDNLKHKIKSMEKNSINVNNKNTLATRKSDCIKNRPTKAFEQGTSSKRYSKNTHITENDSNLSLKTPNSPNEPKRHSEEK